MHKLGKLIVLVTSMSKSEKRFFRLFSGIQAGEKKYLYLYDLILKTSNIEEIEKLLADKFGSNNYDAVIDYLYFSVIDCLTYLNKDHNTEANIFHLINSANVLFERNLPEEAFKILEKAKKTAKKFQKNHLLMHIQLLELHYHNSMNFRLITEREMINKHVALSENQKNNRKINLLSQLYDVLRYRVVNNKKLTKNSLTDLVLSELNIISNNFEQGYEIEKMHLMFQATYYLNIGNNKMALQFYRFLIDFFEEHNDYIQSPPIYYLASLTGILDSFFNTGMYNNMSEFILKIKKLSDTKVSDSFKIQLKAHIYKYEMLMYIHLGDIASASAVKSKNIAFLENIATFPLDIQLEMMLVNILFDIVNKDDVSAKKAIRTIRNTNIFRLFPAYHNVRIFNLLFHIKDYEYCEQYIKSIKRGKDYDKNNEIENSFYKYVLHYETIHRSNSDKEKFLNYIEKIGKKHSSRLLYFDLFKYMKENLT
jgi:hypothetical protein